MIVSGPPTLALGIATLSSNIAITASSAIIFTAFHSSSVTQQSNREANHDTDEADKRSREFGSRSQRKNLSKTCHVEIRNVSAIALSKL